jgi:hypothetical protein
MFVGEVGAYPRVENLKSVSLRETPALLANIRMVWKSRSGTNTIAYY